MLREVTPVGHNNPKSDRTDYRDLDYREQSCETISRSVDPVERY